MHCDLCSQACKPYEGGQVPTLPAFGVQRPGAKGEGSAHLHHVFAASEKTVWREKGDLDPFQLLVVLGRGGGLHLCGLEFSHLTCGGLRGCRGGECTLAFFNIYMFVIVAVTARAL